MRRAFGSSSCVLFGFAFAFASASAAASPADDARAESLFREGRRLMSEHRYAEACPKLEESQRLAPGLGTLLNLGGCYEESGRMARALATFEETAAAAHAAGRPDREAEARVHGAKVAPSVARVRVAAQAHFEATVDGEPAIRSPADDALLLEGGPHVLVIRVDGGGPITTKIDVRPGASTTLDLALRGSQTPSPAPASPEAPHETSSGSTQTVLALAAFGVGVVGLGVGTFFGLRAKSENDASDPHCFPAGCDSTGEDHIASAKNAATVSTVAFVVGAAGIAAGAVLLLTRPRAPVAIGVTANVGSATLVGSF